MAIDNILEKLSTDKITRRSVLKAGAVAGMGLAGASIAGCIGSSEITPVTPTPGAKVKEVVKVGYLPSDHDANVFIAKTKGFFDKYGVNAEMTKFGNGSDLMKQVVGGNIDVGIAGVPPVLINMAADPTVKIIGAVHNNGSGIFIKKGSGIKTIADLKGKTVAIPGPGSIQDIMLRKLLVDNNLKYNVDVDIKTISAGQMLQTMSAGSIDAAIIWEPFVTMAKMQEIGEVMLRSEDIMPGHPCDCIATTTGMIENYPDTLIGFLKAHRDAVNLINTDLNEAAAIVASKEWLDVDVAVEKESLPNMTFMVTPDEAYISGAETFAAELKALDIIKKDLARDDMFELSLLNKIDG